MNSLDCHQISKEVFLKQKNNLNDSSSNTKLLELINTRIFVCSCFHPESQIIHSHITHKEKQWFHKYAKDFHKQRPKPTHSSRTIIGNSDNTSRSITSLLNKISNQNYQKIIKQLCLIANNKHAAQLLIQQVIKKCYNDIDYINMYIDILKTLQSYKDYNHEILKMTYEFYESFLYSLPHNINLFDTSHSNETNLSKYMKLKKELYNKNKCISYFIRHECLNIENHFYLIKLRTLFDFSINDPEIIDICIHFIFDLCSICPSETLNIHVDKMLSNDYVAETCKRTKFKIDDLINLISS